MITEKRQMLRRLTFKSRDRKVWCSSLAVVRACVVCRANVIGRSAGQQKGPTLIIKQTHNFHESQ